MNMRENALRKLFGATLLAGILLGGRYLYGQYALPMEGKGLTIKEGLKLRPGQEDVRNSLSLRVHPGQNAIDALYDRADTLPFGVLVSNPDAKWILITAGSNDIGQKRLEFEFRLSRREDEVAFAQAYLLEPAGDPCQAWSALQLTSIELENYGCHFRRVAAMSGDIHINGLTVKHGQASVKGTVLSAAFADSNIGTINYSFNLHNIKGWVRKNEWLAPPIVKLDLDPSSSVDRDDDSKKVSAEQILKEINSESPAAK